jgi:hypothetical protein
VVRGGHLRDGGCKLIGAKVVRQVAASFGVARGHVAR